MPNHITIELCAEDRARLDRIIAGLEKQPVAATPVVSEPAPTSAEPEQLTLFDNAEPEQPAETPEPEAAPEPQPEPEQPKVERSDIQKMVVSLSGKGKKDEVRSIVLAYGNTKVSDIPEDKLSEVWEKLKELEG